jgi:hypothetical protein
MAVTVLSVFFLLVGETLRETGLIVPVTHEKGGQTPLLRGPQEQTLGSRVVPLSATNRRTNMRARLRLLAATGLVLALGTAGTMAQTPSGSQSQSAPAGLNSNPAMSPTQPRVVTTEPSTTVLKKKRVLHTRRSLRNTTGSGSQSQSAPAGLDYNPAMRSR